MSDSDAAQSEVSSDPSTWLDDHGDYLLACAVGFVQEIDKAEDLVQETLLAAVKGWAQFEGRSTLRTWLIAIMKRKATDQLRQTSRQAPTRAKALTEVALLNWTNEQFHSSGKWANPPRSWPADAAASIESEEFRQVLADCVSRMPERGVDVLRLAHLQGLNSEQIGKHLEITASNVGVILHRTHLALRHCLEKKWFGAENAGRKQ